MAKSKPDNDPQPTPRPPRSRWRRWRARLMTLLIATVVALLMAEVAVRFLRPGFPGFNIPQTDHRASAGLGFEMIPSQQAYTYAETVTINSAGFRGPEYTNKKPSNTIRIVCLGDSLTFGVGVDDAGCYPRQLESILNERIGEPWRIEVINAGVQRYYTYQEIDQFRRYGDAWRPDFVVIGVYPNDLGLRPDGDFTREFDNPRERTAGGLRKRAPWLYLALKRSALVAFGKEIWLRAKRGKSSSDIARQAKEELWEAMRTDLATFGQLANQYGCPPLVIALPNRDLVRENNENSPFPQRIEQFCQQLKLPYGSVLPLFIESLAERKDPYLAWDNHMSVTGNRIVAETIADRLLPQIRELISP